MVVENDSIAVIIDTFEQRVQRCKERKDADAHFSARRSSIPYLMDGDTRCNVVARAASIINFARMGYHCSFC
jgi:hypothetical protein